MGTRPRQRRLPTREDTTVTSVALPNPLYERLKIASVKMRLAAAEIIRRAVTEWLDHHAR